MSSAQPIVAASANGYAAMRIKLILRSIGRLAVRRLREPDTHLASWSLPPDLSSVPRTRRLTRDRLTAWKLEGFTDVAELLVSELVTNALRYSPGPIRLTLWRADDMLRGEVEDTGAELPSFRDHCSYDERGRGLLLLDALTCCWGSAPTPGGKTVWFELPTTTGSDQSSI